MKTLDFIVIGAQKSGTTSLFKYLSEHPAIFMPPDHDEIAFFSYDSVFDEGWPKFAGHIFAGVPTSKQWGMVSPHYMADARAPGRIVKAMPAVKLIAVLRNPVERAFSHYHMLVRRGLEQRPFAQVIDLMLQPDQLNQARRLPYSDQNEQHGYVAWGEYGRILAHFLEFFDSSSLLILFTDELAGQPAQTWDKIARFLNIDPTFVPANLGRRYHRGGYGQMPPDVRHQLVEFYRPDIDNLRALVERPLPWPEWSPSTPSRPAHHPTQPCDKTVQEHATTNPQGLGPEPVVVCMMRIKNEERWLAESLAKTSELADAIVILDDGSTDNTPQICKQFPKVLKYVYQDEPDVNEVRDKNRLLKLALECEPDWILALDGDEVLEDVAPHLIREAIANCPAGVAAFELEFLYFWNDRQHYRVDGKYANIWHPRLFRVAGQNVDALTFSPTGHGSNFHGGSVPGNLVGQVARLETKVKHYGYLPPELRRQKYQFYCRQDPAAAANGYYDHLIDEATMILNNWHERTAGRPANGKPANYYQHARPEVANLVPKTARKILDVGCATGQLGAALKRRGPDVEVVGIELDPQAASRAAQKLDRVLQENLDELQALLFPHHYFDCIIFADVLEHLRRPEHLLDTLKPYLSPGGSVVISIPNARHYSVLLELLVQGRWDYQAEGILDQTHLRFFTWRSLQQLLANARLAVDVVEPVYQRPDKDVDPLLTAVAEMGGNVAETETEMAIFQYVLRAVPNDETATGRCRGFEAPELVEQGHFFGPGFYPDEGGWRWMSEEGAVLVSSRVLPALVSFELTCGNPAHYRRFPFQVQIFCDQTPLQPLTFSARQPNHRVQLTLDSANGPVRLKLRSDQSFVPSALGLNPDSRTMSIRLSRFSLEAARQPEESNSADQTQVEEPLLAASPPSDLIQMADDWVAQGNWPAAQAALSQALESAPTDPWLHVTQGSVLLEMEDTGGAAREFLTAIELDSACAAAHAHLAAIFLEQGDIDEAILALRRVVELEPENPVAHEMLQELLACGWQSTTPA